MQNSNQANLVDGQHFRVHYENRSGYLFAQIHGPNDSLEISLAYWLRLAKECRARNVQNLLVVDQLQGEPLGILEIEKLIEGWKGSGLEAVKTAFVELDSVNVAFMEHGEIYANALGFSTRVFTEIDQAERWLKYGG